MWHYEASPKLQKSQRKLCVALKVDAVFLCLQQVVPFVKGQPSKDLPLQEKGLALPTINRTVNKQCTTPTDGRNWECFAAFAHQTETNEERLWIR